MAIKVSDLAKKLGVDVDVILEQLQKMYVDAESASSKVDEKIVGLLRIKLGVPEKKAPKKEKKKKAPAKEKKTAKKKEEKVPKEKKKKEKKAEEEKKPKKVKKEKVKGKKEEKVKAEEEKKPAIKIVKSAAERKEELEAEQAKKEEKKAKEKPKKVEIIEGGEKHKPAFKKAKKGPKRPMIEVIEKEIAPPTKRRKTGKTAKVKAAQVAKPAAKPAKPAVRKTPQKLQVEMPVNIRTLAPLMNLKPNDIMQYLMGKGALININQDLEEDVVKDIMDNFGFILEIPETIESMEKALVEEHEEGETETRAPVVTFMGHVDHGKTSLLDYIRKTMVTKGEKGGITQHIGAYKVETPKGAVTFLDTPGHAAFTAMRARGAHATDVVVLVVAADDGVMPQTKEAIDHARAAEVPIVVAINKCDLPGASPDRVRQDLQKEDLSSEDWGGETIMVEVSAQTGEGVDELVEMLMLESEMLELKAKPSLRARGVVIEGKKTPGQGVVATLLVQNGTLYPGDIVLCGNFYGRVKAMNNDKGDKVDKALPATPVEVLGLQGVPEAGEEFFVVKDEKKAKTLSVLKQDEKRKTKMASGERITLEDLHSRILEGTMKELKIVIKADVQGSVEAIEQSLADLSTKEVKLETIHSAVGNINESDVMLAMVSNAVIIGFHVKIETKAEELVKAESVDVRLYDVIYEAIADVEAAMEGLLEPEEKEVFQGRAQVKEVFSAKTGKAAGCSVIKGVIHRNDRVRLKRGEEVIFEGNINALKRFKDDVKEAKEGFECGITLKGHNDIKTNDVIEAFSIEKIARRLEKK